MTRDSIRGFLIIIGVAIVATVFFNASQRDRRDRARRAQASSSSSSCGTSGTTGTARTGWRSRSCPTASGTCSTRGWARSRSPSCCYSYRRIRPRRPGELLPAARHRRPGRGVRDVLGRAGVGSATTCRRCPYSRSHDLDDLGDADDPRPFEHRDLLARPDGGPCVPRRWVDAHEAGLARRDSLGVLDGDPRPGEQPVAREPLSDAPVRPVAVRDAGRADRRRRPRPP